MTSPGDSKDGKEMRDPNEIRNQFLPLSPFADSKAHEEKKQELKKYITDPEGGVDVTAKGSNVNPSQTTAEEPAPLKKRL